MPELPELDLAPACSQQLWFALQVKPRHEKSSAAGLLYKGYESLLPLHRSRRRWSDRVKAVDVPLFPGYVFCRFDPAHRVPILTTPGVASIVGNGKAPVAVADAEVAALKGLARSGLDAEPWPYLEIGSRVRIGEGPLYGVEGVLLRFKQQYRLVLSVTLLRRSVAVEVDARWVEPAKFGAAAASE